MPSIFALARDISTFSDAVRGLVRTDLPLNHFSLLGLRRTEEMVRMIISSVPPFGANQRQHFASVQRQRNFILIMARQ